ncbi:MAG: hypothetical protein ACI9W2_001722 [Gammaproteobacteria bacterium]
MRPTIIGYGHYHCVYESGREDNFQATRFSPRKANLPLYTMPGYQDYEDKLALLSKHRTGKACLYANKLTDIDLDVLRDIVESGLFDLNRLWPGCAP